MRRMHASERSQRVTLIAVFTRRALILWTFFGPVAVLAQDNAPMPSDAELERSGAVIGEVLIDNANVFDLRDPKDDTKLFRFADHLHARTRQAIIRWTLLFKPGDKYQRRVLQESERILRQASYFYDASVEPVAYHDGKVDVLVKTGDVAARTAQTWAFRSLIFLATARRYRLSAPRTSIAPRAKSRFQTATSKAAALLSR